jgi:hypothetical protein
VSFVSDAHSKVYYVGEPQERSIDEFMTCSAIFTRLHTAEGAVERMKPPSEPYVAGQAMCIAINDSMAWEMVLLANRPKVSLERIFREHYKQITGKSN